MFSISPCLASLLPWPVLLISRTNSLLSPSCLRFVFFRWGQRGSYGFPLGHSQERAAMTQEGIRRAGSKWTFFRSYAMTGDFFFFFTRFWGTRSLNYLRSLLQEKECEFKIRHTALEVPQRFSFITFIVNPLTSRCESWSLLQYLSPKRGMNQQLCQDTCRPSGSYLEFCVSIMCLKVHSARTKHDLSDGLCSVIPEMRPWDQELW